MPELPEVETIRRDLAPILIGRTFCSSAITFSGIAHPSGRTVLAGIHKRKILNVTRRGKYLILLLSAGGVLIVDLRMTGQLTMGRGDSPVSGHTHARFRFSNSADELRFTDIRRFGRLIFMKRDALSDFFAKRLGPEPSELNPKTLKANLKNRRAAIKTALLNQKVVAGLGNIYADEVLHAAGLKPTRRAGKVTHAEIRHLLRAMQSILRTAVKMRGSTLRNFVGGTGLAGRYQERHRVFRLGGKPCSMCGTLIRKITLGGRSTHFCPTCQS